MTTKKQVTLKQKRQLTLQQKQQYSATIEGNSASIRILERQEDLECFDLHDNDFSTYFATIEDY